MRNLNWIRPTLLALTSLALLGCMPENLSNITQTGSVQASFGKSSPTSSTNTRRPSGSTGESGSIDRPVFGSDTGTILPLDLLFCGETGQIVLKKGQGTLLHWAFPGGFVPETALQMSLEATPSSVQNLGTIAAQSNMSAWYQAPATVPEGFTVAVRAVLQDGTVPAVCRILLIADEDLGIVDDGTTRGAVGKVYPLPANTSLLPDFSQMTSVSQILMPSFDVAVREFDAGFPGVPDLFEWFGIHFAGRLVVPTSGTYQFKLNSDDGSRLIIDGVVVINNDGTHAPRARTGSATLTAGNHGFELDYFQGPRYHIALELFWQKPGDTAYSLIPPDAFLRPAP